MAIKKKETNKHDKLTELTQKSLNVAESTLGKTVGTGLDTFEGVLKAVLPFSQ